MSSLTALEKRTFERLFSMESGYVLNFSNRTFASFIADIIRIDVYSDKYAEGSGSKANRLRALWRLEPDHIIAKLTTAMLELMEAELNPDPDLLERARAITRRLSGSAAVDDIGALEAITEDSDFETLARTVHDSIAAGEPEVGLDRLHTFVAIYLRTLATREGVVVTSDKPLHSVLGELVKALRARGAIETEMADRILRSTISTFESFSTVRNERSFAHPNPLLSFDEALLVFRHVASAIRFLKTVAEPVPQQDDGLPF